MSRDLLILSASTGNGHLSAALALQQEAESRGLSVRNEDVLDFTSKAFAAWYRGGYELLVKRRPELWGDLYEKSDEIGFQYNFQTKLDLRQCKGIDALVLAEDPKWVVVTHSLPQPRLDFLRAQKPGLRLAAVITDLYPHRMWLRGKPDVWFVPSAWTQAELEERWPESKGKIVVTGIPIGRAFGEDKPREEARRQLGLPESGRMALLTAGGIGAGPMDTLLESLAQSNQPLTAVVVCGKNEAAKSRLESVAERVCRPGGLDARIWGQASQQQMADLMHACNLLVGKPGGLTTSEALAAGCPFLVADPFLIPGQEEGNADFLVQEGIGVRAATAEQAAGLILELLADEQRLAGMRAKALEQANPKAAPAIIDWLQAYLKPV